LQFKKSNEYLGLKDEKRKSKANRDSIACTAALVEQLRRIMGLSLDEAVKHNPLPNNELSVPRFLVECINIIEQGLIPKISFVYLFISSFNK